MATSKPQIRSLFATPVSIHFLPVAQDVNASLRPLIAERAGTSADGQGWCSDSDISWCGEQLQTIYRVARDLADAATTTRTGGRVTLPWNAEGRACLRHKGEHREFAAHPRAFWSGIYYVDDGYAKSDDPALGGECELADPRGTLPATVAPQYAFRIPGGQSAAETELIRPASGMIILHPSWLKRGERRHDGEQARITIEFDLTPP